MEVMVALGLFVILLSILWNVIALFTRSQTRGSQLAERSQLVRSLAQLLEDDLRAAIQDPIHPFKGSGGDDDIRRFGLSGNAQTLRIDVIEINPFAQLEPEQRVAQFGTVSPSQPKAAELKTVFYVFNNTEGLTRREIDFETPDLNAPGPEGSRLSAPEIIDCRFRYFDGTSWSDSWESLQRNGLPVAIEADLRSVSLANAAKVRRQQGSQSGSIDEMLRQLELPAPIQQRMVVYLPASPVRKFEDYKRRTAPKKEPAFPPPPPPPLLETPVQPPVPPVQEPSGPQETWIRNR